MRRTISRVRRRTSSDTIDIVVHPTSCNAACFWRSLLKSSGPECQSNPSYSTASLQSGQAKSTPDPAVPVDDLVLEFRVGQPAVVHRQSRFAFHR